MLHCLSGNSEGMLMQNVNDKYLKHVEELQYISLRKATFIDSELCESP